MTKDRLAIQAKYFGCRCGGHTCHRCMQTAAQLRAWNMSLEATPVPEAVTEAPTKKNKKNKEDN